MDLVIRDVRVIDGTGGASYRADVAVDAGRVAAIHREQDGGPRPSGRATLEAHGLPCPPASFIDMHAHSDLGLLRDPGHEAKVAQGVTLEVIGQDGLSYAPVDDRTLAQVRTQIAGWNGGGPGTDDVDFSWRSVGEYLDRLDTGFDGQGIAVNAAYLIPQGTVRILAVGWDDRPATPAELTRMRELVATGLTEGAVGMSSGLTYTPGMYASDAELTELCRVVAAYDGYYCPHHRSYRAGALQAYEGWSPSPGRRAARCTGARHHELRRQQGPRARAAGPAGRGAGRRRRHQPGHLPVHPRRDHAGRDVAELGQRGRAGGDHGAAAGRGDHRAHPARDGGRGRRRLPRGADRLGHHGDLRRHPPGAGRPRRQDRRGQRREEPFTTAHRLLLADDLGTTILQHVGHEENVRTIMRHPVHTGGSNGILQGDKPHPRAYGTFPHYLGRYARDLGVLPLEECVAHLTSRPAARLRLPDRGLVRTGYRADLVLFDPETVAAGSTFEAPRTLPTGIPHVLIDGRFLIQDGRRTDVLAGRSVRRAPTV